MNRPKFPSYTNDYIPNSYYGLQIISVVEEWSARERTYAFLFEISRDLVPRETEVAVRGVRFAQIYSERDDRRLRALAYACERPLAYNDRKLLSRDLEGRRIGGVLSTKPVPEHGYLVVMTFVGTAFGTGPDPREGWTR